MGRIDYVYVPKMSDEKLIRLLDEFFSYDCNGTKFEFISRKDYRECTKVYCRLNGKQVQISLKDWSIDILDYDILTELKQYTILDVDWRKRVLDSLTLNEKRKSIWLLVKDSLALDIRDDMKEFDDVDSNEQ